MHRNEGPARKQRPRTKTRYLFLGAALKKGIFLLFVFIGSSLFSQTSPLPTAKADSDKESAVDVYSKWKGMIDIKSTLPYEFVGKQGILAINENDLVGNSDRVSIKSLQLFNDKLYLITASAFGVFYSYEDNSWKKLKEALSDKAKFNWLSSIDFVVDGKNEPYMSAQDGVADPWDWPAAPAEKKKYYEWGVGKGRLAILKYDRALGWEFLTKRGEGTFPTRVNNQLLIKKDGSIISTSFDIQNPHDLVIQRYENGKLQPWNVGMSFPGINILRLTQDDHFVIGYLKDNKLRVKIYLDGSWADIGDPNIGGTPSSLVDMFLDENDNIYLAYQDGYYTGDANTCNDDDKCGGPITLQRWTGDNWVYVGKRMFTELPGRISFAVTKNNDLYASFSQLTADRFSLKKTERDALRSKFAAFRIMTLKNGVWTKLIDIETEEYEPNSLVADSQENLYLLLSDRKFNVSVIKFKKNDIDKYLEGISPQPK